MSEATFYSHCRALVTPRNVYPRKEVPCVRQATHDGYCWQHARPKKQKINWVARAETAEAEVARLKERNSCAACQDENTKLVSENASLSANFNGVCHKRDHWKARAEAAEAKLRAVGELPTHVLTYPIGGALRVVLRDELEALLKKDGAL